MVVNSFPKNVLFFYNGPESVDYKNLLYIHITILIIIINICIAQIPCEYDQMRVTNKGHSVNRYN